jgi:hypothetical protein
VKFSVVIVNYAAWPLTLRCVESLYATGYEDFEVVIVDNDMPEPPEIPHPARVPARGASFPYCEGLQKESGDVPENRSLPNDLSMISKLGSNR